MLRSWNEPIPSNTSWIPHPGVTNHAGTPILENSDFFVRPPIEVGRVISAETTLAGNKKALSTVDRLKLAGVGFMVMLVLLLLVSKTIDQTTIILSGLTGWFIYYCNRFNYSCSYVGEGGFVGYAVRGRRTNRPQSTMFCFQDDMTLYTGKTHININGGYRHTLYFFVWKWGNKKQYRLSGKFDQYKQLKFNHPLNFAHAAEIAWNQYFQSKIASQLKLAGYVDFPVNGSSFKTIRLGQGFVEFLSQRGQSQRFPKSDIDVIKLQDGKLKFTIDGEKSGWLFDKYAFAYDKIGNAQLLIVYLEKLLEIKIGDRLA
jgi:hypothetical protein